MHIEIYFGIVVTKPEYQKLQQMIVTQYNAKITQPATIRGCNHTLAYPNASFCAQCGKKAYVPNPAGTPLTLQELEEMSVQEFDLPTLEYFTPYYGKESESIWPHVGLGINVKKLVQTETLVEAKNKLILLLAQEAAITTKPEDIKFWTSQ